MPLKDAYAEVCREAKVELDFDTAGVDLAARTSDLPITITFKDEPLESAIRRIFLALWHQQGFKDVYWEWRGEKFVVPSQRAQLARTLQNLPDWLKPLYNNGLSATLDQDGNVVSVSASGKTDDVLLAMLQKLPKVRNLDIQMTTMITPAGLAHLAELPVLEKLHLYEVNRDGTGIGNDALRIAAQIKTLRELSVAFCGVTDDGVRALVRALEGMIQLTALDLSHNWLTDAGMKSLAGLTNLQSLDVSGPRFGYAYSSTRITDEGIKQLSRLTELRKFSIDGLGISGSSISFPHLQSLDLRGDLVTDAALDSIVQCRELRHLGLEKTSVSDDGMRKLTALTELRQVNLDSARITDAGIACLKTLPKLEQVQLRATRISNESLRHLSEIRELRQLSLESGLITDAGIAYLEALPKLEHLELRATALSDLSLRNLSRIKSLTHLDLDADGEPDVVSGQLFTIRGLQQLKNLPQLRELAINNFEAPGEIVGLRELAQLGWLTLRSTTIQEGEAELLQAAMPNTSINVDSGPSAVMRRERPHAARAPLPSDSVYLSGRTVDDATDQPVANCVLQFGAADPARPGEITWGEATNSPRVEVSGNGTRDPSRFWGETFRTGKVMARILAAGYTPYPLTPDPALSPLSAPLRMTNLVVRMRKGGDLHGIVLDYHGNPVPGVRVYLAETNFYLRDGAPAGLSKSSTTTAGPDGCFTLQGGNGTEQRVVAASADGQMVGVAPKVDPGHEAKVTLPQPATLVVRYDIPDDAPVAQLFLNFLPQELDPAVWKGISLNLGPTVTNHGELVLTNLTPGPYRLARRKMLSVGGTARSGGGVGPGMRIAWLLEETLALESGQTKRVDLVRSTGQSVHGEVAGITEASALGAYIYAFSSQTTNGPAGMLTHDLPLDALTCGKDGLFQMALLEPGAYTFVAVAFKEPGSPISRGDPDYMGAAKVTVTTNAAPPPVKFELRPWVDPAKAP